MKTEQEKKKWRLYSTLLLKPYGSQTGWQGSWKEDSENRLKYFLVREICHLSQFNQWEKNYDLKSKNSELFDVGPSWVSFQKESPQALLITYASTVAYILISE